MNNLLKLATAKKPTPIGATYAGRITCIEPEQGAWFIDGHFEAGCAADILVKPQSGDLVGFVELEGRYFITQVLEQSEPEQALHLQSDRQLHLTAPQVKVTAFDTLDLLSLGKVAVSGKTLVTSAANAMIQQAENLIQQVGQFTLTAKGLLRLNGKQQVITAEKDVRIDGKRINMG